MIVIQIPLPALLDLFLIKSIKLEYSIIDFLLCLQQSQQTMPHDVKLVQLARDNELIPMDVDIVEASVNINKH